MKTWLKASFIMAVASSVLLTGCGNSDVRSSFSGQKLKVTASIYPMVEFTKQVAGDHAEVIGLVPAGVEPHDWEPSAKEMKLIKEADVFVYNGIVEGWAEAALGSAANDKRIAVEASKGLAVLERMEVEADHKEEQHEDEHDPHVWLSPVLAQKQVAAIQTALEKADPAHKDDYKKNAELYIGKLQELDQSFKKELSNPKRKEFVTQHTAFAYLAQEYGLQQLPIAGLSPEQEPTPDKMISIVKFAKEKQISTIFFETLVDPKVAATIAKEIGAKTEVLNPLEGLTDDERKNKLDYIGVMRNNLAALRKALNE